MEIKTRLNLGPCSCQHEMPIWVKGATGVCYYDFLSKAADYSHSLDYFNTIKQLTYSFGQRNSVWHYEMIIYLVTSADTGVVTGKRYFSGINTSGTYYENATEITNPTGSPADQKWREVTTAAASDGWTLDKHFKWVKSATDPYANYIVFSMFPSETKDLELTDPGYEMPVEVATEFEDESVIIEPQHPIAVIDSLYRNIV